MIQEVDGAFKAGGAVIETFCVQECEVFPVKGSQQVGTCGFVVGVLQVVWVNARSAEGL